MRYCTYCGMPMEDDDLFCTRCGRPAGEAPEGHPGDAGEETVALYDGAAAGSDAGYGDPAARYGENDGFGFTEDYGNPAARYGENDGFFGHDTDEGDRNRTIFLVASAVIVVAVLGILLTMLVRPGTKKDEESAQDQVAVYEEDENGTGGQNLSQGSARPASGENETPASETEPAASEEAQGAPAGENSGGMEAGDHGAGAGQKAVSGQEDGAVEADGSSGQKEKTGADPETNRRRQTMKRAAGRIRPGGSSMRTAMRSIILRRARNTGTATRRRSAEAMQADPKLLTGRMIPGRTCRRRAREIPGRRRTNRDGMRCRAIPRPARTTVISCPRARRASTAGENWKPWTTGPFRWRSTRSTRGTAENLPLRRSGSILRANPGTGGPLTLPHLTVTNLLISTNMR